MVPVDPNWAFRVCAQTPDDLDMDRMSEFIRSMRRGMWDEERNAINPIVITAEQTVRNGAHRLGAIAAVGRVRHMYVTWEGS